MNYESLIEAILNSYSESERRPFVIAIGGCSQAGKSTLGNQIKSDLQSKRISCSVLLLDNWLLGLNERTGNETVRERYRYSDIADAIVRIKAGEDIQTPVYDRKTRCIDNRTQNIVNTNADIIIIDGVVALDIEKVREFSDFKVFVDIDDQIRKERLNKFYLDYKACSLEETAKIIQAREIEEVPIAKRTINWADVVYKSS